MRCTVNAEGFLVISGSSPDAGLSFLVLFQSGCILKRSQEFEVNNDFLVISRVKFTFYFPASVEYAVLDLCIPEINHRTLRE